MLTIKNIQTPHGDITDLTFANAKSQSIDAGKKLIAFPAFINTDLGFSTFQNSSDWLPQAHMLLQSGISTVFDKKSISPDEAQRHEQQLAEILNKDKNGLHIHFFCNGSQPASFDKIGKNKQYFKGIKTSMDLAKVAMAPYPSALDRIFQIAAQEDLIVVISLQDHTREAPQKQRNHALATVKHAIALAEKYSAQLCLQHVRTSEELTTIKNAKERGILVFTEVAYPHLFLSEIDLSTDAIKAAEIFLPSPIDHQALWKALNNGSIDIVGSGTGLSSPEDPIGLAKMFLPIMLNAYNEKKLSLDTLIGVTHVNAQNIFRLPPDDDVVLVDMTISKSLGSPLSKKDPLLAQWAERKLTGWPVHVIAKGELLSTPA